jgi:hypothetical protein
MSFAFSFGRLLGAAVIEDKRKEDTQIFVEVKISLN